MDRQEEDSVELFSSPTARVSVELACAPLALGNPVAANMGGIYVVPGIREAGRERPQAAVRMSREVLKATVPTSLVSAATRRLSTSRSSGASWR